MVGSIVSGLTSNWNESSHVWPDFSFPFKIKLTFVILSSIFISFCLQKFSFFTLVWYIHSLPLSSMSFFIFLKLRFFLRIDPFTSIKDTLSSVSALHAINVYSNTISLQISRFMTKSLHLRPVSFSIQVTSAFNWR